MNEASAQAGDGTNASREIQQLQLLSASGLDQADPALLVTTSWPSWVIVHLEKSSVVHALGGTGGQTVVLNLTAKFVGSKPRTAERERERTPVFPCPSLVCLACVSQLVSVLSGCPDIQVVAGHMTVQRDLRSLRRLCW